MGGTYVTFTAAAGPATCRFRYQDDVRNTSTGFIDGEGQARVFRTNCRK